jgi:hypothetical protein
MIVCKIKGRKKLTDREQRFLSEYFRDMFMAYDLEYVFLGAQGTRTDIHGGKFSTKSRDKLGDKAKVSGKTYDKGIKS